MKYIRDFIYLLKRNTIKIEKSNQKHSLKTNYFEKEKNGKLIGKVFIREQK